MMLPFFAKNQIVAVAALRWHQLDIGGMVPGAMGGEMTESFQEGIRIPPVKTHIKGKENQDVWNILLSNVRVPKAIREDMRSVHGALRLAERRILQLVDRYGANTFQDACEQIKNISETMMRNEISTIPEGRFQAEDYLDDDGFSNEPVRVKVTLTIRNKQIIADYEGSSKQVEGCINTTYGLTASETYTPVLDVLGAHIPTNHGCYRPIKVIAPPGTVVNANYPAATVGGNVETSGRIFDTVMAALSKAVPQRVLAACHGTFLNFVGGGVHPDTQEPYVWYLYKEGAWGGRSNKDGNSAMMGGAWSNDKNQPVETIESSYPLLVTEYSLNVDQAGAGKYRGGLGTRMVLQLLGDAKVSIIGDRFVKPPYGLFGGRTPRRSECGHWNDFRIKLAGGKEFEHATELFHKHSDSKWSNILMHKGDVVEYVSSGGGGYGDPLQRDSALVQHDALNGYISLKTAREEYGVVLNPKTFKISKQQTGFLRTSTRSRRRRTQN
jgi:N-methylhydantoinase B/oxoprolinase/acetone carboxylase alpha subunit